MEDKQKVWIYGVEGRGEEVINALENLGGKNKYGYAGVDDESVYFINHKGNIALEKAEFEYGLIIMDNYHEIKLPESPKGGVKMKQRIQFTGKNLNEIFALPCVCAIKKTTKDKPVIELLEYDDDDYKREYAAAMDKWKDWKHSDEEMYVDMRAFNSKYPKLVYVGDWLVEQDNGGWRVEKGGTE